MKWLLWGWGPAASSESYTDHAHTHLATAAASEPGAAGQAQTTGPEGEFYSCPFIENSVQEIMSCSCSVRRYTVIIFLILFWILTHVKLLKKLVTRILKEGNEMYWDSIYTLSSLRELRDKGWKTYSRSKGWELLLSSEMSISELKDHSETTLFIIQLSCVLSFTENNSLWMLCRISSMTRGKAVVWGVRLKTRKRKVKKKQIAWGCGEEGRVRLTEKWAIFRPSTHFLRQQGESLEIS